MLLVDGVKYRLWKPSNEDEYESFVVKNAKHLFGEEAVFLNLKTLLKSFGGVGSIPDGFVIYLTKPGRWGIVEVELSTHQVYEHILVQLNKFMDGYNGSDGKRDIVKAMDGAIRRDPYLRTLFSDQVGEPDIHRFLSNLVDSFPDVVVVVDEKTAKIEEACRRIREVKGVLEFKVFERVDGGLKTAFLFGPDVEERGREKVKRKQVEGITAQGKYTLPLLEVLVETGGSGRTRDVLEAVHEKMKGILTPADHEKLPSGSDIRWKNHAMWERMNLKRKGYISSASPRGVMEITDKGRKYLVNGK